MHSHSYFAEIIIQQLSPENKPVTSYFRRISSFWIARLWRGIQKDIIPKGYHPFRHGTDSIAKGTCFRKCLLLASMYLFNALYIRIYILFPFSFSTECYFHFFTIHSYLLRPHQKSTTENQ